MPLAATETHVVTLTRAEFLRRFGAPDLTGALCGYTREDDTRAILTMLCHAAPMRVLEIGTALGHMTANLTRWTLDDARIFSIGLVQGMARAAPGATEQRGDTPVQGEWGRFANHFGTAHKAFFIMGDSMTYDFGRLAPLDFVFIDGSHEFGHVVNDSRKAYDVLVPGGWLVWHDFNSPVPWVQVREATERIDFREEVVHVEGTEVAFLSKGEVRHWRPEGSPHLNPPPHGGRRLEQGASAEPGASAAWSPAENTPRLNPPPHGGRRPEGCDGAEAAGDGQPGEGEPLCEPQSITPCEILLPARTEPRCPTAPHQPAGRWVRVAWEGDFEELHSLALVNRAICRELIVRGHDVNMIAGAEREMAGRNSCLSLRESRSFRSAKFVDPPMAGPHVLGAKDNDGEGYFRGAKGRNVEPPLHAQVHVRHQWPPQLQPPACGRWVLMQPWEFGSLPKSWLPMLERVDEVWAYSRYVRDCYLDAGVPGDRVHLVPLGVDPEVFRPGLEPLRLAPGPEIRFLFVGGTIFRKGIDVLLRAFGSAFRPADGVGLVIKEMGSRSFYCGQTARVQVDELRERGYPVEYIDRNLSEAGMAGLYSACDCLVHPFRGEGFALPVVEAMACGLPVIVTGAGPALDYATEETAYLIPAHRGQFAECRVGDIETIGRPWLFEPAADALVELLRRVASDRAGARTKGMAASAHIRGHFTWARTADAVEGRSLALAGDMERRPRRLFNPEPTATATIRAQTPSAVAVGSGLNDPGVTRPKISLTMIVRDEEKNLPCCLASVAGLFDEIVVVDTGSKDRTPEIARDFGARVFDFVWVGDFAAARNAALARATGDYAFWLDADDVIEPPQRERLEPLLANLRPGGQAAYVVRCACDPGPNGDGGQTVVDHIRLFPVRGDIRWTYRVHEQILPALRRAKVPVHWSDITVRHTGYTDRELRARKLERDCKILLEELSERPDDPFVLFNLGSIAVERREWREALDHLRHSLAGSAATDSITRKLYALIARSHQMLGEFQQALGACATGLAIDAGDAELLFREAIVRRQIGDNEGAERCWRQILALKRPDQFSSVDQGIYGHLTRRNLAVLAKARGDHDEAKRLWRAELDECPDDREARSQLGD